MTITANQMTFLRLIFLPIPCALLFGGPTHKGLALLLFIAAGLTDYLDGHLARKHGATRLGALIDPMADKIYITAMFVPLAWQGIVPIWMVLLLFIREYTVTELRSIHGSGGVDFRTSELAKYKTTIQMIGGGVIILNEIFRQHWTVWIPLGAFFAFSLLLATHTYRMRGRLGSRILTLMSLIAWVLVMRALLPYDRTNQAIMALIVAVTLLSGLHYALLTWRSLKGYVKERFGAREWASFVGIGLLFPAFYLSTLHSREVAVWTVIAILSVEFAIGGLKNFLTTLKGSGAYSPQTTKILFLNGAGLLSVLLLLFSVPHRSEILNTLLFLVFAASLLYCLRFAYRNRHALIRARHTPA
jgi:CDP-diacylglycerol--glycerol-3-phosphate 3-phosphatidyltransferase